MHDCCMSTNIYKTRQNKDVPFGVLEIAVDNTVRIAWANRRGSASTIAVRALSALETDGSSRTLETERSRRITFPRRAWNGWDRSGR